MSRVQFVVELVGQYATRSASIGQLLQPQWYAALGQPNVFVLKEGAADWNRLVPGADELYDSICMAWNYLTPAGRLSTPSAGHLMQVAESYANQIGRYAVSLTPVHNVDAVADALQQVSDQLDAGLGVAVVPRSGAVSERDLWILCSNLGLQFSGTGAFDWLVPEHPHPVLSVTPLGGTETFSLAAVQSGAVHQGASISFRLATCPAASVVIEATFKIADVISRSINGVVYDDSDRPLTDAVRSEIKTTLEAITGMLNQAGCAPGSPEALAVFQ